MRNVKAVEMSFGQVCYGEYWFDKAVTVRLGPLGWRPFWLDEVWQFC